MHTLAKFIIFIVGFAHFIVLVISAQNNRFYSFDSDFDRLSNSYLPSRKPTSSSQCTQCRPNQNCTSELDIRDENIPREVEIPTLDYQIRWERKPIQVVQDFDVRENPVPIVLQLQDKETRVEPKFRKVEKIVKVRVARIRENVIVKKIDRVKLVPIIQKKSKPINIRHVRQVPAPRTVQIPKNVVQRKYTPETVEVPVPIRIANTVLVTVNRVDKPVDVPNIQFQYCEKIQEIQVKANCPPVVGKPDPVTIAVHPTSRPPISPFSVNGPNDLQYSSGHSWNGQRQRPQIRDRESEYYEYDE